jgi:hypothetical protein
MEILVGYTYAKSLDNSSDVGSELVSHSNPRISKGLSDFDVTHNFVFSYVYKFPFDKLLANHDRPHSRLAAERCDALCHGCPCVDK